MHPAFSLCCVCLLSRMVTPSLPQARRKYYDNVIFHRIIKVRGSGGTNAARHARRLLNSLATPRPCPPRNCFSLSPYLPPLPLRGDPQCHPSNARTYLY